MNDMRRELHEIGLRVTALSSTAVLALLAAAPAHAQQAQSASMQTDQPGDIIVTAQKREQRVNDVPMSITALASDQLRAQRVLQPEDLQRVVPGLSFTPTQFGTPVYTVRGVGFYDTTLSASPAVSVYVDEVALPFPAMARGAMLDLERVEVLKGPQGTLFGQNSTGGAVNYVTAKPTPTLTMGADASVGRFSTIDLSGYVSGPLSQTLDIRVAAQTNQGAAWQRNYTRPDKLGETHFDEGRVAFAWRPSAAFHASLDVTGWRDRSDTQAPQLIAIAPSVPAELSPLVAAAPLAPSNARAANWNPDKDFDRDNDFIGVTLRGDFDISDAVTLTSISAYQRFRRDETQDISGTTAEAGALDEQGKIDSYFQELRLSGRVEKLRWVLGGNYEKDNTYDQFAILMNDASNASIMGFHFPGSASFSDQDITTKAVFANVEYNLNDRLKLEGGVRYTDTSRGFRGCTRDWGEGSLAAGIGALQGLFGVPATQRAIAGGCVTLNGDFLAQPIKSRLGEDNVSWRAGIEFKPFGDRTLFYANVSRGYKAGSFPTLSAAAASSLAPARQETLLAYEAGYKISIGRRFQVNGAVFHYDYDDKQLVGNIADPIFGRLAALVNIPKSRINGAELQLNATPISGLTINTAVSYTDSKILRGSGVSVSLTPIDLAGASFPYSPKWQFVGSTEYRHNLNDALEWHLGGSLNYRSRTKGGLSDNEPLLHIKQYAVLDLRAGIGASDGKWDASLWAQNVTNAYYWTNAVATLDTVIRYAGRPATYGIAVSFRY